MAVAMIGPKFYAWDRNGKPLAFGKLYTYQARTNTPKPTYQSEDQVVENTNPVILNGEGYANVYLDGSYKMVLKDDKDNEIWSSDPVSSAQPDEWVNCLSATYVGPSSFKVNGNFTAEYGIGRRVRIDSNSSTYSYSTITSSVFASGETTVTVSDPVVTTGIQEVCVSIVGPESMASDVVVSFDTLEKAVEATYLQDGYGVYLREREPGNGGGALWNVVLTSTVTPNDFNIVQMSGNPDLSLSLALPNSDPIAWGATGDGVADDKEVLELVDAEGSVHIARKYAYGSALTFTKPVNFVGGNLVPNLAFNVSFQANSEIDVAWFGAVPDATLNGEAVEGTDNYEAIQATLFSAANTNGKKTVVIGGGDYRIDQGLRNWSTGVGTCSIIGKGLLGARFLTDKDITALWVGGSAQTIKRLYVLFANPTAALANQIGVRFASDDFQWSQSVIEQVWVQNAQRSFVQANQPGTFGTIFLNTYRNLQSISNRDWGFYFDSKNGSTTIHLDTCYVKGQDGGIAKGMYFRRIKDILLTNCALDKCVNEALDVAAVNEFNAKNLALESCSMTNGASVLCNLNATSNHIDGFTSTVTTIDVGASTDGRILFFGGNANAGNTVKGFFELGTIETSGNFVKAAISAAATRVQILDDSVKLSETVDNGFVFGFGIKGQDFSRVGASPDNSPLTGDRERGHVFWNAAAQVGQPKYWVNTTGGPNSTYVSGGVL